MKQLKVKEKTEFLTPDYVYVPITSKEEVLITEDKINKGDKVTEREVSPVSGRPKAFAKIMSLNGLKETLMIENDFKDKRKNIKVTNKDIYKLNKNTIREIVNIKQDSDLEINIYKKNNYDLKDLYILKEYEREILETINLIDQTYDNINVKILVNKEDISTYELLFNYMGTYPKIEIVFKSKSDNQLDLYNVLDIYNRLKNKSERDYIYLSVCCKNVVQVLKTKKYINLKEVLDPLNISYKSILINDYVEASDVNYLLDDQVYEVKLI